MQDLDVGEIPPEPTLDEVLKRQSVVLGFSGFGVSAVRRHLNVLVVLNERKAAGIHDTMQFTYRNPTRSSNPSLILPGAKSIITVAYSYSTSRAKALAHSSPIARYARYDSYGDLNMRLVQLERPLRDRGFRTRIVLDSNALVDKEAAVRAGVGVYLKNSLLAVRGAGTYVVIGNIVTDALLERSQVRGRILGCGTCEICLDLCPTGAIGANATIDARRCISWILQRPGSIPDEFRKAIGLRVYGCDICQEVCPYNSRWKSSDVVLSEVNLIDLQYFLTATDGELLTRFSHLYISKRDPNILRRNALVALGNYGYATPLEIAQTLLILDGYVRSGNDILKEHALWSYDQIQSRRRPQVSSDES